MEKSWVNCWIESGYTQLTYKLAQAVLLANANEEFLKGLLLLDTKGGVHVYPESARQAAQQAAHNTYLYTADTQAGLLTGYSLAYSTAQVRSQVSR